MVKQKKGGPGENKQGAYVFILKVDWLQKASEHDSASQPAIARGGRRDVIKHYANPGGKTPLNLMPLMVRNLACN